MVSTTQEQQPDGKLNIFWLPEIKAKEDKLEGKQINDQVMEKCQHVSKYHDFDGFSDMEIRSLMHTSWTDPTEHITARLRTTLQKESETYQIVHVYSKTDFRIFTRVVKESDYIERKELRKKKKQERQIEKMKRMEGKA